VESSTAISAESRTSSKKFRLAIVICLGLLILLAAGIAILASHWPFTADRMKKSLSDSIGGEVQFGRFRQTYFPHPGCVAENLTISQPGGRLVVTRFTVESSYAGLLSDRISRVTADSSQATLSALGAFRGGNGSGPQPHIGELILNGATLQIGSDGDRFLFHKVLIRNIGDDQRMPFQIDVGIPRPAGELSMNGTLGSPHRGALDQTALAGSYRLQNANLGIFKGLAGNLSSDGNFSGVLSRLDFQGHADTPDFTVTASTHRHHLKSTFRAVVNAMNGDTQLTRVDATFDRTAVSGTANIAGQDLKTITLNVDAGKGRIEDLMTLFIKAPQSPMLGPVTFRANVIVPPGAEAFKKKVILGGDFGITSGNFSKSATQAGANELSERAEGEPHETPERVLANLRGHVVLRQGIAMFSNTSFEVPGAKAQVAGKVNVINERLDLEGHLAMQAELSKTETGIKSVFLKLLDPIYKKRRAGSVVPLSITGTYDHPQFNASLTPRK